MNLEKIISLAIVSGYFVAGIVYREILVLVVLFPLALIWFGDELGEYLGTTFQAGTGSGPKVTSKSPGWLVRLFGWFFLIAPLVVGLYMRLK